MDQHFERAGIYLTEIEKAMWPVLVQKVGERTVIEIVLSLNNYIESLSESQLDELHKGVQNGSVKAVVEKRAKRKGEGE